MGQPQNPDLVGKEHHDGVEPRAWRCVLDCEGVIVILNDVEVDVSLQRPHHSWGTLDANADITCGGGRVSGCRSPGDTEEWNRHMGQGLDQDGR